MAGWVGAGLGNEGGALGWFRQVVCGRFTGSAAAGGVAVARCGGGAAGGVAVARCGVVLWCRLQGMLLLVVTTAAINC